MLIEEANTFRSRTGTKSATPQRIKQGKFFHKRALAGQLLDVMNKVVTTDKSRGHPVRSGTMHGHFGRTIKYRNECTHENRSISRARLFDHSDKNLLTPKTNFKRSSSTNKYAT